MEERRQRDDRRSRARGADRRVLPMHVAMGQILFPDETEAELRATESAWRTQAEREAYDLRARLRI